MLDAAWEGGVLSDFAKRQLFMLVVNRAEEIGWRSAAGADGLHF